jgi:hypothetical protein
MEYTPFNDFVANYLPASLMSNDGFVRYLNGNLTEQEGAYNATLYTYTDALFYSLPSPRYKYYESSAFEDI